MHVRNSAAPLAARKKLAACVAAVITAGGASAAEANPGRHDAARLLAAFTAPHLYRAPALAPLKASATKPAARTAAHSAAPRSLAASAVTSCEDDGGFDTLRHAVTTADPATTIDLSALPCSTITLQSGAIAVDVSDLTIIGPGSGALTIDANGADRVFKHSGLGTLTLSAVTLAHGKVAAAKAYGGCIFSNGSIELDRAVVTGCAAVGQADAAAGALFAYGTISLQDSTLSNNLADAQAGMDDKLNAAGGAAVALLGVTLMNSVLSGNTAQAEIGNSTAGAILAPSLTAKYSTLTGNKAIAAGTMTSHSSAGAAYAAKVFIRGSTIDHNQADVVGALYMDYFDSTSYGTILQSTISSNVGNLAFGAVLAKATLGVANSTIAFNTSGSIGGPALGIYTGVAATIESTILADNSPQDLDGGGAIGGANNLIKISGSNVTVPVGTFTLDPQLGPLQLNGGHTRTHALTADSPAIDQGDDLTNVQTDQRGTTYHRVVGAKADIGAYELDADHVFGDGVEATPPLI